MISTWHNEREAARRANVERPLTRSLDLREEGLAMQATRTCSLTDCDRPHYGKGLCQRHLERKRRLDRKNAATAQCTIDGCADPITSRGWCEGHYRRWLDHGDPTAGRRSPVGGLCTVEGCDRPNAAQTWCALHYYRWKRTGKLELVPVTPKICVVDGCDQRRAGYEWCRLHYERWARNGDPLLVLPSSRDLRGPLSPNWRGRDITYYGAHTRVAGLRGRAKARKCVDCGKQAAHWSYDHADPDELVEPIELGGKRYSDKPEHYEPRCNRCHTLFDRRLR